MFNIIIMSFLIGCCGGCYNISYDLDTEVLCCESKMTFIENGIVSYESENVGYPCGDNGSMEYEVNESSSVVFWVIVLCISFCMGFICYPLVIFLIIKFFY